MTIEELTALTGAPNATVLGDAMKSYGLTVETIKEDAIEFLKGEFTPGSLAQPVGGAVAKKKSKKGSSIKRAQDVVAVGVSDMDTIAVTVRSSGASQLASLSEQIVSGVEEDADAIASLVLAYPGLVNQLAAQKINEGLADAAPGFCWPSDNRSQEVVDEVFSRFRTA